MKQTIHFLLMWAVISLTVLNGALAQAQAGLKTHGAPVQAGFSDSAESPQAEEPYKVSAEPSPAHVLIEEFTGLHCSYCPQAHAIANNLTYVAGDRIHVMAVHVGGLAAPSGDELDLRCSQGGTFYSWQGASGMPSGNINRTVFPECIGGSYSLPRSAWPAVARRLLAADAPAPVNLYAEARYDQSENRIYIDVEAFSAETAEKPLFLNVALTENFVPGTQAGNSIRPYLHRHVLSDVITPVGGDPLTTEETAKGAYAKRGYTYTLPEKFNNRAPNVANLACMVFVTDGTHAVLNSLEAEVESPVKAPLERLQIALYTLEKTYSGPVYDVYVVNPSDDTIRSLSFTLDIDKDTRTYELQDLCLLPKTEGVVHLQTDFDPENFKSTNLYTLRLTAANGHAVEANQLKDSFKRAIDLPATSFKISFTSDLFGSENTVTLTDERGEALYEAGPFADGEVKTYMSEPIKVEAGRYYTLRVTESWRDGVYSVPDDQDDRACGLRLLTETDSVFYSAMIDTYGHLIAFRAPGEPSGRPNTAVEDLTGRSGQMFQATLRPNPADLRTELQVTGLAPDADVRISIYNLQGGLMEMRRVRPQAVNGPKQAALTLTLPLSAYPQGFYLVRVEQNGRQQVAKLVVRR